MSIWVMMVMIASTILATANPDCNAIRREVQVYKKVAPSAIQIYKDQLEMCNVHTIHSLPVQDYFKTEYDTFLTLSSLAIRQKVTHPALLNYMVKNKRWDLLLSTLDTMRNYEREVQISSLNEIFYKNLPDYFDSEIKEIFNFFSSAEKIAISQQLIPSNQKKIKALSKKNQFIVEFWPLFDQLVFINHFRELYPAQFESMETFWKEKLISYYYDDVESQDPSFKMLTHLLNREWVEEGLSGANMSLRVYYAIKLNQFETANKLLNGQDNQVVFNNLRYFELFTPDQQSYLLSIPMDLSISDIQYLFEAYYLQVDHPAFKKWVWNAAISNGFNCDVQLKKPYTVLRTLPQEFQKHLKELSPMFFAIKNNKKKARPYFFKKNLSFISPEYNTFSALSPSDKTRIVGAMVTYIKSISHGQFMTMLPQLTLAQQFDILDQFPDLEIIPTKNRRRWTRITQPKLARNNRL